MASRCASEMTLANLKKNRCQWSVLKKESRGSVLSDPNFVMTSRRVYNIDSSRLVNQAKFNIPRKWARTKAENDSSVLLENHNRNWEWFVMWVRVNSAYHKDKYLALRFEHGRTTARTLSKKKMTETSRRPKVIFGGRFEPALWV